jgi:hypothetical protein
MFVLHRRRGLMRKLSGRLSVGRGVKGYPGHGEILDTRITYDKVLTDSR